MYIALYVDKTKLFVLTNHLIRCLDEIPRPIATTRSAAHDSNENRDENGRDASGVVCLQCKKSFKSKRGLSMHLRKCPGTVTEVGLVIMIPHNVV